MPEIGFRQESEMIALGNLSNNDSLSHSAFEETFLLRKSTVWARSPADYRMSQGGLEFGKKDDPWGSALARREKFLLLL